MIKVNKQTLVKILIPVTYSVLTLIMIHYAWNEQISIRRGSDSPLYQNLMDNPAFIRRGFDPDDILAIPGVTTVKTDESEWVRFSSPPLSVVNSNLPDLPKRTYLSPFGKPNEEFTILIQVDMDNKAFELLKTDPHIVPGVYFSIIAENWEIFLNGNLVRSEMHIDENLRIKSRRSLRDVYFPLDKHLFKPGTNTLALRIIGDPTYNVTGFYYTEPYYIDDYQIILNQHQSYLRYFFCGILGFTGISYLLIFLSLRKKNELFNLYYSIFSIMLCLYFATTSGTIFHVIPNSDIPLRLEYFSIIIALSMLCIFIENMGMRRVSKTSFVFMALFLYIAVTQIFFCAQYGDETNHLFIMIIFFYFTYVLFNIFYHHFIRQRRNKNRNSNTEKITTTFLSILIGSLLVYVCGIFEGLDIIFFRSSFRLFVYSTFVFHIGMALTMSNRVSGLFRQLEHSYSILEKTVQERTLELEKQTVIAVQASKAKSQFLATMSHEIRTPLNAVIGLSEVELRGVLPESSRNNINQIHQSGSTLLGIINDILDISKIEAGGLLINPVKYSTAQLINDAVNLNKVRIGKKPIAFILDINDDFPSRLLGDELRIKQVLNNIISNAIKYTREGCVFFSASWEKIKRTEEKNSSVQEVMIYFKVKDTGIGIHKEDMERLFSEYSQLNAMANRKIEGTGLGLVISKKLVEMMDGTIVAESEFGKGSVFTVSIKQVLADTQPIGKEVAKSLRNFSYVSNDTEMKIDYAWMPYGRVLVVDDMPVNISVIKGLLEPYDLKIDTALSGREAIAKLQSPDSHYDLVFMDHMMPGMDGIETTEYIRAWEKEQAAGDNNHPAGSRKKTPIIALTANALSGNSDMFLSRGFDGFISKPIDANKLDKELNLWIHNKENPQVFQPLKKDDHKARPSSVNDSASLSPETQALLNTIPGLDVKSGIAAVGGSLKVFCEVLLIFCSDVNERMSLLKTLPDKNTLKDFIIQVHAIKSACASICAKELSLGAAELEAAGKDGNLELIKIKLPAFISLLTEFVANINSKLGTNKL